MKVAKINVKTFENYWDQEGERITVGRYTWGEPFDEGVRFTLHTREAMDLYQHLDQLLLGLKQPKLLPS